jgi:hypothetical protein
MLEIQVDQAIGRPPTEVFVFVADMGNNPSWQKGMQQCRWTSEPPLRLGSTYDQVAGFLGREIVSSFEVTEFETDERIRIQTTAGTMPLDITRSVESDGADGSVITAIVRGDASGVFRLAEPLMRLLVRSSVRRDYRRLKELLET